MPFFKRISTSPSVHEMLLPSYMQWSTNFRGLLFDVKKIPSGLKHDSEVDFLGRKGR